jgi:hypothetical protein
MRQLGLSRTRELEGEGVVRVSGKGKPPFETLGVLLFWMGAIVYEARVNEGHGLFKRSGKGKLGGGLKVRLDRI